MGKQLVNFITFGCESSAPFFVIYKAGREPTLGDLNFEVMKYSRWLPLRLDWPKQF
jgi:hypothetical protein